MEKHQIKKSLEDLRIEFKEIFRLLDFPLEGLSTQENLKVISQRYSDLKDRVNEQLKELERRDRNNELSKDEQAFLLPAISEVSLHCSASKGSMNKQALSSSLYDGQDYCSYYSSQINV